MIPDRTPVIVGVGQITCRPGSDDELVTAPDPIALMTEAARLAAADSGAPGIVERMDAVYVPQPLTRRYPDPGRLVAPRLGVEGARCYRALVGGNSPQLLMNEAASAIQRGTHDVALIVGAEAMHTRFRARRAGIELPWERSELPPCSDEIGDARPGTSEFEQAHGARIPIEIYPLFETAIRAAHGRDPQTHQREVGVLWARFAAVAAANPHAWNMTPYSSEEIITPGPGNRVVTFPYLKRMCANMGVNQGAAVLLASYGTARGASVPEHHLVFPLAGADAHDHYLFSERWSLAESPAIRTIAQDLAAATRIGVDDVSRFDLYSCFPSAVEVASAALNLAATDARPITLTGGLALFGGPGNNYMTHSIAETVMACRQDPGSVGMATGVGWYLTKHSAGLYSTRPLDTGFQRVDPASTQPRIDALPRRQPAPDYDGDATVEATAVPCNREGAAERAIISALTPDGRRALAVTSDPDTLASMMAQSWEGRRVTLKPAEGRNALVV